MISFKNNFFLTNFSIFFLVIFYFFIKGNNFEKEKKIIFYNTSEINATDNNGETELMLAVKSQNLELVNKLIKVGADIGIGNNKGETCLMIAVKNNNSQIADVLINNATDVNAQNNDGETALILAVKNQKLELVNKLVKAGADTNLRNKEGETSLELAAEKNNLSLMKILIDSGAKVNITNSNMEIAFLLLNIPSVSNFLNSYGQLTEDKKMKEKLFIKSIKNQNLKVIKLMAERKVVCINQIFFGYDKENALHIAIEKNMEMVKILVENGININKKDRHGWSPFLRAVGGENFEIVKYLVDNGADVNDSDSYRRSALMYACSGRNFEIIKYLVENGANVNHRMRMGWSEGPLTSAAGSGNIQIVKYLVSKGAKLERGVLEYAVRSGNLKLVKYLVSKGLSPIRKHVLRNAVENLDLIKYLISQGADIKCRDKDGNTLLMYTAYYGNIKIVEYLLEKGLNIYSKNKFFETVLMWAAKGIGKPEIIPYLNSKGLKIDDRNKEGKTALIIATEKSNFRMMKSLIFLGADVNATDNKGRSVLSFANSTMKKISNQAKEQFLMLIKNKTCINFFTFYFFFSFLFIFIRVIQINFKFKNIKAIKKIPNRGNILDVNGNLLVYSQKKYNVYVNKKNISKKSKTIIVTNFITNTTLTNKEEQRNVVKVISTNIVNWQETMAKLSTVIQNTNQFKNFKDQSKNIFLLQEYISEQKKKKLVSLKLPFLLIEKNYQRKYFLNNLLSHSLGFTGRENHGLNGLEYYYEDFLSFQEGVLVEKNIYLHIDLDIQYKVEQLLAETVKKEKADSGVVIVQNIKNKKIIAIANFPNFDLTQFKKKKDIFNNQAVSMNISPGSIFKIFFLAYLLEIKKINFKQKFYCNKDYYISKKEKPIKCNDSHGSINVNEILKYSCNSAMIEICKKLTKKEMYQFLTKIKIGSKSGIDLPYEGKGILPNYRKWKLRTKSLIPIGYGLTVTPIQMINGFSTIIGNGYWQRPKIANQLETYYKITDKKKVKKLRNSFKQKILSLTNIQIIRNWLLKSVEKGSTGYLASKNLSIKVLGKTSTAQIIEKGTFSLKKYNSGFAGAFPFHDPKYSILVIIKNPKPNHSGGKIAAPLFNKIVKFIISNKKLSVKTNITFVKNSPILLSKKKHQTKSGYFPNLIGLSFRDALVILEKLKIEMENNNIHFNYIIKNEKQRKRSVIGQSPSHLKKIRFNKKNNLVIFFD